MQNKHRLCKIDMSLPLWEVCLLPKALANPLESPSTGKLRTLNIYIEQGIPGNHNFKNQPDDPKYTDGDVLNVAIRNLAESTHLKYLNLTWFWLVSPALFNGEEFPCPQKVEIQGALITGP